MAGGVALGSIFARLGIDSSQFQGGLGQAEQRLGGFGQRATATGVTLNTSLTPKFGVAALAAQQLAAQVAGISKEFATTAGISPALVNSVSALGLSAVTAAGAYGKLNLSVRDFSKLGPDAAVSMGAMAASAFSFGNAVGKLALEMFPELGRIVSTVAEGPTKAFGVQLATNEELFRQTSNSLIKLRGQLGLTGDEWRVSATRTKESAARLADLYDKALLVKRGLTGLSEVATKARATIHGLGTASADALSKAAGSAASLREQFGVLTAGGVKVGMVELTTQFRELAQQGVSARQLFDAFGDKVASLETASRDYKGLNIPKEFKDLAAAVGENGSVGAVAKLAEAMATKLPVAAATGAQASKSYLAELGTTLEGQISGGFGRGMVSGISAGRQALDALKKDTAAMTFPIVLKIDPADLQRQIKAALAGTRTDGYT